MNIEKVTYQKTYSIGPYLTDRVGFEASIPNDMPTNFALSTLEQMADAWHKEAHPHLYQEKDKLKQDEWTREYPPIEHWKIPKDGPLPIISKDKEKIEIAIDNAESVEELKIIKKAYELMPASCLSQYNKRMTELTSGKPKNFTDGLE